MEKPIEEAARANRIAPEDDVAGHGVRIKVIAPVEDDDVEGHAARGKA